MGIGEGVASAGQHDGEGGTVAALSSADACMEVNGGSVDNALGDEVERADVVGFDVVAAVGAEITRGLKDAEGFTDDAGELRFRGCLGQGRMIRPLLLPECCSTSWAARRILRTASSRGTLE